MSQWFRSGLEGYCKKAAEAMGLPDDNSGWGNFGRDLFADGRFDDPVKASKTWTLSRFRSQGRSNRPKLFEESWLGKSGGDYELTAIHTCVQSICNEDGDSALYDLYQFSPETFASDFHIIVLPAIEGGFAAERYHASEIERFSQGIDKALSNLNPALPQTFRNFAIPLVAGIIYGPDHVIARSGTSSATLRQTHGDETADLPPMAISASEIILTQVFSDDLGLIGHSSHFDDGQVILLGRDSNIDSYLSSCDSAFAEAIASKKPILFPVPYTHKSTSKAHGAIARMGDTWYYYDFSANGSYVENAFQPFAVHRGVTALAPGDRIHLGLSEPPADDSSTHRLATTVLVSFRVDETGFTD